MLRLAVLVSVLAVVAGRSVKATMSAEDKAFVLGEINKVRAAGCPGNHPLEWDDNLAGSFTPRDTCDMVQKSRFMQVHLGKGSLFHRAKTVVPNQDVLGKAVKKWSEEKILLDDTYQCTVGPTISNAVQPVVCGADCSDYTFLLSRSITHVGCNIFKCDEYTQGTLVYCEYSPFTTFPTRTAGYDEYGEPITHGHNPCTH